MSIKALSAFVNPDNLFHSIAAAQADIRKADQGKPYSYFPDSFNLEGFLTTTFPKSVKDGEKILEQTAASLKQWMEEMRLIPHHERTFDNRVMSYHDQMTKLDSVERLIRSERLIPDEAPGKAELIEKCIALKNSFFSNAELLWAYLCYAEQASFPLSPENEQYLKGIVDSITIECLPEEQREVGEKIKQSIAKKKGAPHLYLRGSVPQKVLKGETREFSFLTLNLCMMPEACSMIYGGPLPWPLRIDAIAEKLKHLDDDVLCLQEVYDPRALSELHKRLGSSYTHFYGNIPLRLCGFSHASLYSSSGLALISKFEISNLRFTPYSTVTDEDKPSAFDRLKVFGFDRNYGLLQCDILSGQKTLAHIATTHTNPFFASVREKQVEQIVELFAKKSEKNLEHPLILCGDLNIEQDDLNEGGERLLQEHFVNYYPMSSGPTWFDFNDYWHKYNRNVDAFANAKQTPWTVDRSLLWKPWTNKNNYSFQVQRVPMNALHNPEKVITDHHGILTYIKC